MSYFWVKLVHLQENFRLQHENRKCPLINTYYFRLWISTKDGSVTMFKGVLLSRYAFVEQRDGTFKCWILFPVKGKYKFEVFNKPTNDDVKYSEVLSSYTDRYYIIVLLLFRSHFSHIKFAICQIVKWNFLFICL